MGIESLQPREMMGPGSGIPGRARAHAATPQGGELKPAGKNLPPPPPQVEHDVHAAAELIDRFLRSAGRELSFSVDQVTGRTVVSIRDPATGSLIRQLPSEEALRIARNLDRAGPVLASELA
jgi:flagellar protein FlaG